MVCGKNCEYQLPVDRNYINLTIVHLQILNIVSILVAVNAFAPTWLIVNSYKSDNDAVVKLFNSGK